MATATEPLIGSPPPPGPGAPRGGGGGGDDGGRPEKRNSSTNSVVGIVVLMVASSMTFGAMFFALIGRRAMSNDWHQLPLPRILWWNTAILILSSVAIDLARRRLRRNRRDFNILWSAGTVMGTWFLVGQAIAWFQLESRGFYLRGSLSSAFFYVLTWAHAAHVVGALAAVYYVEILALRYELGPNRRSWVNASSLFWHFLDAMWLAIMGIFVFAK